MFVGNICYVSSRYNETTFRLLLENHFKKSKGSELSSELVEQCLSAYLECKDSNTAKDSVAQMSTFLTKLGINYSDTRSYDEKEVVGNPEDAVKVFNKISFDFIRNRKSEYER